MTLILTKEADKVPARAAINDLQFDNGKSFVIVLKENKKRRTIDQNRLMWLWLSCIENETGQERESLHEFFKSAYLQPEYKFVFGVQTEIPPTTTKLNTAEFTHYLERIQQFASTELSIVLPNPEDLRWAEFYETYKNYI
ncbi:MAG: recombination protein NinB [Paludibacter sp.]|nr:recombination protein NinB [Paludibacter sp.]